MINDPTRSPVMPAVSDAVFGPEGIGDLLQWGELLAWWDASEGIAVTGSGVSSWIDRQSAYVLAQATDGARPAYSATGFNGSPGLTFAGTATVNLQWQVDGTNWRTIESYTSSTQKVFEAARVPLRLNCSAHTNDVTYAMLSGD